MASPKIDYKRELPDLYTPGVEPLIVNAPELAYLMIDGHGDPNTSAEYGEAIQALYAVAYSAKFAVKGTPGGIDYGVMPLEGLWWTPDMSKFTTENKSAWDWTLMIMQPDQVTAVVVEDASAKAAKKKSLAAISKIRLEGLSEGLVAQITHIGPYAAEGATIQQLHAFIAERGYQLRGKHHEVYLSDPRRVDPEKLKTILRQPVAIRHTAETSPAAPEGKSRRARRSEGRRLGLRRCACGAASRHARPSAG